MAGIVITGATLKKRRQVDRLLLAEVLLSGIWKEFQEGEIDDGLMQLAVDAQIMCNRIVWKLNEKAGR